MSYPIKVVDYDPEWPLIFEAMKQVFETHLGNYIIDIQHVGSTSIPGLAAKPKLDIDLIVADEAASRLAIIDLQKLDYTHAGDLNVKGREAFRRKDNLTPNDNSGRIWMEHNLYVCLQHGDGLKNHIAFRDYLRSHPDKVKEYAELKRQLALLYPDDIDTYCSNKTDFITGILKLAGLEEHLISDIRRRNLG